MTPVQHLCPVCRKQYESIASRDQRIKELEEQLYDRDRLKAAIHSPGTLQEEKA